MTKKSKILKTSQKVAEVEQALQELEAARQELQRLNQIRAEALISVKNAQKDYEAIAQSAKESKEKAERGLEVVGKLQSESNMTEYDQFPSVAPEYHSKEYWDARYQNDDISCPDSENIGEYYEWYVSFQTVSSMVAREITALKAANLENKCSVMVPGCGNSLLGEELMQCGATAVVGIDYSSVIVEKMKSRLQINLLTGLEYREGDVCNLVNEINGSYDLIVDKGTLDAIASGSSMEDLKFGRKIQTDHVGSYLKEMWRVLKIGGYFVVITTMPEDIMDKLVLPQLQTWNKDNQKMIPAYGWKSSLNSSLIADGGGKVFYYALRKLACILAKKDLVLDAINSLVEEAIKVKENDEWQKDREEEIHNAGHNNISHMPVENILDFQSERCDINTHAIAAIEIEYESSYLVASGHVVARFSFDGIWNDSDEIRLIAIPPDVPFLFSCYHAGDPVYESFEYVDTALIEPASSKESKIYGKLRLQLPHYGVRLRLMWLRALDQNSNPSTIQTHLGVNELIADRSSFSKKFFKVAESKPFCIKFPVLGYNPFLPKYLSSKPKDAPSRRSAKPLSQDMGIDTNIFHVVIEDLQNIGKLSVTVRISGADQSSRCFITRAMAFVYQESPTQKCDSFTLLLETDIIGRTREGSPVDTISIETVYLPIRIVQNGIRFDQLQASTAVGELLMETAGFVVRLPYNKDTQEFDSTMLNSLVVMNCVHLQKLLESHTSSNLAVFCNYCDQILIQSRCLQGVHPLPTGIFDEHIHEFLCCEDISCMALTMDDLAVRPSSIYIGSCFGIVHGSHVQNCTFSCKTENSLFDLYNSMCSSIWSAVLPPTIAGSTVRHKSMNQIFRPVVCIDAAAVRCTRCSTYLGEASLVAGSNFNEEDCSDEDFLQSYSFKMDNIDSVKFLLNRIAIRAIDENTTDTFLLSSEQIIARICVYIFEKTNNPTCAFFNTSDVERKIRAGKDVEVIVLRLMSKGFRKFDSHIDEFDGGCKLKVHTKLSSQVGTGVDLLKGTETRVPLDKTLYMELKKLVQSNSSSFLILHL